MLVWVGLSLLLSAASLTTMPLTQRIWTWDHFLHGGHDFESVALLFLIFFCLVLVLSKHCKHCVACFSHGGPVRDANSLLPGRPWLLLRDWHFRPIQGHVRR